MTSRWTYGNSLVLTGLLAGAVACGGTGPEAGASAAGQLEQAVAKAKSAPDTTTQNPDAPSDSHSDSSSEQNGFLSGRMTGGGGLLASDGSAVTYGFEVRCDESDHRQNLQVNWGHGHHFRLENLQLARCYDMEGSDAGSPAATFNTFLGGGTGQLDGAEQATIQFLFNDSGEPGNHDVAAIMIYDAKGEIAMVASGELTSGNMQAHRATGSSAK